jgi:hypothetical protein
MNRSGPRIDPWGTPDRTGSGFDVTPSAVTLWNRPEFCKNTMECILLFCIIEICLLAKCKQLGTVYILYNSMSSMKKSAF